MLKEVRQLNARCFAQLVQAAKAHRDPAGTPALELLSQYASQIDARVSERAGSCPVLLLDLDFKVPEHWDRVMAGMHMSVAPGFFTKDAASPLLHEILMQAWSLSHAAPHAARLFFGMAPEVTEAIAKLTGEDLERIAEERVAYLRPRWEDRRTFWVRLLEAAVGTNEDALVDVHLHCLSLLGGDLVPVRRVG